MGGVSGEVPSLTQFRSRSGRYAAMPAERRARSSRKFRSRGTATAFGVGVILALAPVVNAGAIGLPTSFAMSPSSGPPGTTVQVSGNGCSPGLLFLFGSSSVMINAGTMPPTSVQVPAQSNGAWRGTFKIPASARATAAEITATCVSGGLQSLLTFYWPKTFTVGGRVVPTTPSLPVSTPLRTSTTSMLSGPGTAGPTTTSHVSVPNDGAGSSAPGASTDTAGAGSGNGSNGRDGAPPASGTASGRGATASGPVARAADLRSPELSVSRSNDGAGLGWLLWLLVLSVPVGALALYAWMRHARRAGVAGLEPDST